MFLQKNSDSHFILTVLLGKQDCSDYEFLGVLNNRLQGLSLAKLRTSACTQLGLLLLHFTVHQLKKVDSVTQHPSSSHGSSSCSFLPSPQLLLRLPAWWQWWRGPWLSRQHKVGCLRRPEKLPSAVEGPGRSCCGSHQCGGVEHVKSCWRPVEAHSHSSMDCLAEQKKQLWETKDWEQLLDSFSTFSNVNLPTLLKSRVLPIDFEVGTKTETHLLYIRVSIMKWDGHN